MINNTDYEESYTTVADQTTWYPISFVYYDDPNTGLPELIVNLDGNTLTYPTEYILGPQGLQLTTAPAAGLSLTIFRNPIFEQLIDFQTGIIDPEQIESGFDRSVMRDLYLYGWLDYLDQYVQDTFGQLSDVAWSGDYNDLINTPTIGDGTITLTQNGTVKGSFTMNQTGNATIALDVGMTSVDWSDITNKPTFATVATTGSYNDLLNKPVLATVATTGSYNDLLNKPTLATVATTGSYNDLLNKPTLGTMAAENASDYTKTAGLATVATTGSYNDLLNKPTIPTVGNATITLTQGGVTKGIFTTNQGSNATIDFDAAASPLPSQTGNAGKFLITDGTNASWGNEASELYLHDNTQSGAKLIGNAVGLRIKYVDIGGTETSVVDVDNRGILPVGNNICLGSLAYKFKELYVTKISNGSDIDVPNKSGTMVVADYTGATQGDVLTLDSNGDPVWQAAGAALPSQTGHSGEFLTTDGTDPSWAVATAVTFRVWGPNE